MTDISVQGIVKSFEEDKNILDGISFDVLEGERVGLLGPNGCGKTTLFRILTGELLPDEGTVAMPVGKRIGLISQIPEFPIGFTAEDVLRQAFRDTDGIQQKLRSLEKQMETETDPVLLQKYDRLSEEFRSLGGYDCEWRLDTVVNGLQIPPEQRRQEFASLSGGEKTRLNLARLILEDTDILLLDEPTNHLDLRATEWLEEYLHTFKGTVLTISHDRYFLDSVVTRTVEIVHGKAEFYSGNYSFYVDEKQRRRELQQKKYDREQAEIKRLSEAADRLYQWGTGNQRLMKKSFAIQSRIARMSRTERPENEKRMSAKFREKDFKGDEIFVLKGICKAFQGKELFRDVELTVFPGDRIALIGDNGSGKTTLLKILLQEEKQDGGIVKKGPAVKTAYLPQTVTFAHPERTVLDTMVWDENVSPETARNRLGAFRFSGEDVFHPVSGLSGGERSRLKLCILMKDDMNFLILDEPTNHLDIDSREWMEEAVESFGGSLLFVSHDRYFISRFANRIWELENGKITDFIGTFEEFRLWKARQAEQAAGTPTALPAKKEKQTKPRGKTPPKKLMERLEKEIAAAEEDMAALDAQCTEFSSDYAKLMELAEQKEEKQAALSVLYQKWEELALQAEADS